VSVDLPAKKKKQKKIIKKLYAVDRSAAFRKVPHQPSIKTEIIEIIKKNQQTIIDLR
jgi:hypothetical protein